MRFNLNSIQTDLLMMEEICKQFFFFLLKNSTMKIEENKQHFQNDFKILLEKLGFH